MVDECIFCKIAKGEIKSDKICENDNFFSILDLNQDIKGHCLVISKNHFENNLDLPNSLGVELIDCIKSTALKIMEKENAQGFNLLGNNFEVADQEINHFHVHIFPRKKDDGVKIF